MSTPPATQDKSSSITAFVKERLARRDEDRFWLPLTLLLGFISCAAFLIIAFQHPGSIPDDSQMFLSWMGRFDDPSLLQGDLMANYWASVSPWFYQGIYRLAALAGIKPVVFVKILPALLYPLMAFYTYRLLRSFRIEPIIAFIATAFLLHILTRGDLVISGTPRALWPLLTLVVLDGLSRQKIWQTALGQLLLTGSYPQMALVTSGVIGLSAFMPWQNPWIDFSRRRIIIIAVAAAATIAGIVPFMVGTNDFDPTMTLAEAREIPTFQAGGRGQIFREDGSIDFFCSKRTGIFSDRCDDPGDPKIIWLTIWYFSGALLLFFALFRRQNPNIAQSALPLYLVASSFVFAGLAAVTMFKFHVPSRYMSVFFLLPYLSTLPIVLGWLRNRTLAVVLSHWHRLSLAMTAGLFIIVAGGFYLAGDVKLEVSTPQNPPLLAAIAALPQDTVVGGFVMDLDFSPVFTNRSTLFNRELAIAYQRGYFIPILQRMQAMRDLILTQDPAILGDRIRTLKLDQLVIEQETLANPRVPQPFRGFFGKDLVALEEMPTRNGLSLVAQLAPRCTSGIFGTVLLLDTACILTQIAPR